MAAQHIPRLSPTQYLEIERAADFKSEYYRGEMFAVSGGTYAHALIGNNFSAELRSALKGHSCSAVGSDLRIRTGERGLYTYPDATVICGEPEFADGRKDTLANPFLIVQVLSKSTEAHDRGLKFAEYRLIDSLREYVLVSQTEPRVETFLRQPGGEWIMTEFVGFESLCILRSLEITIPLAEIYARVPPAALAPSSEINR